MEGAFCHYVDIFLFVGSFWQDRKLGFWAWLFVVSEIWAQVLPHSMRLEQDVKLGEGRQLSNTGRLMFRDETEVALG